MYLELRSKKRIIMDRNNNKIFIIGLDGATWRLLDLLMQNNLMPELKSILKNGTRGILESTMPPITGPAWVSFATGKNPGKHGCYDFLIPNGGLSKLKSISTKEIQSKTFYEYLEDFGKKVILINLPCSFPFRVKNGIVVTDFLSQGDQLIYPQYLEEEIQEIKDYKLAPKGDLMNDRRVRELTDDIIELENVKFEITKKLFNKKWDLFFVLFSGTDWIQHIAYNELISGKEKYAIKIYKEIDKYLKWFMENISQDTTLLIVSDHGFRVFDGTFRINDWLEKEGYLKRTQISNQIQNYSHQLEKEMLTKKNTRPKIKIPLFMVNIIDNYPSLSTFYFRIKGLLKIEIEKPTFIIDISKTYAYGTITGSSGFSGIYLNSSFQFKDGIIGTKENYETVRNELIAKLRKDEHISNVWKKEEVYNGNSLNLAPDIIVASDSYVIDKSFNYSAKFTRNEHDPNGIFVAYNNEIKGDFLINSAKLIDIAPTILHIFGMPVPKDMDGRVLKEILREDSDIARRPVIYQDTEETEKQRLKQKIKSLKMNRKL